MFRNYVTTALRLLLKDRTYSWVNIGGLGISLAACILISLHIQDETRFDQWLQDSDRLHKIELTFDLPGRDAFGFATTPGPTAAALAASFPSEIEAATRLYHSGARITQRERTFSESVDYVDDQFFKVFPLPMLKGQAEDIFKSNVSLILSQSMATKYFGRTDPLGQTLTFNKKDDYKVVGVFRDIPRNSHFESKIIALFDPGRYAGRPDLTDQWTSASMHSYLKLSATANPAELQAKFPDFVDRTINFKYTGHEQIPASELILFNLIAVQDIHLLGTKQGHLKPAGSKTGVIVFTLIALLIALIATLNYVNLATARAMRRAREVAMRKVFGATRAQLIKQFLGEAIITAFISLLLALALAWLALPTFNNFLAKDLALALHKSPSQLGLTIGLVALIGLLGGSYPAFVLSSFRPAQVLTSNSSKSSGSSFLRSTLVFLQFVISIGLITSTAIVYAQTQYIKNLDLGFEKDHKIQIRAMTRSTVAPSAEALTQEFLKIPGVLGVTAASDTIPKRKSNNNNIRSPALEQGTIVAETFEVGLSFFEIYGVEPLAGRLFSSERRADLLVEKGEEGEQGTASAIVNISFARKVGWPLEETIGKQVYTSFGANKPEVQATIIGVMPDLHLRTLRQTVAPMIIAAKEHRALSVMTLDIEPQNTAHVLAEIDRIWAQIVPDATLFRTTVADSIDKLYKADQKNAQMFALFSLFAISVACLGLFGLAAYFAEKRKKEIAMRKVLGAGVRQIVTLMIWQFSKPILGANLLAWPLAYYTMTYWLQEFVYRIDLVGHLHLFITASLLSFCTASLTVLSSTLKSARANPALAIRDS